MAIGLKNAASIVSRLVNMVDYSVQEECLQYEECDEFKPFINANKPVFHVEYTNGGMSKRDARKKDKYDDFESDDDTAEGFYAEDSEDPYMEDSYKNDSHANVDDSAAKNTNQSDIDSTAVETIDDDSPPDHTSSNALLTNNDQPSPAPTETSEFTSAEPTPDVSYSEDDSTTESATPSDLVESKASGSSACAAKVLGFSSIIKELQLGAWVQICA